jgi:hypothetical protein
MDTNNNDVMAEPDGSDESSMPRDEDSIAAIEENAEQSMRRMSRRSFLMGGAAIGAGFLGWRWLITRRPEDGIPWPLRRALDTNGALAQDYFSSRRSAPVFPASRQSTLRTNGDIGLGEEFDASAWKLRIEGLASGEPLELSLDQIKKLPRVEMITELKCIEGWSIIVKWTGARMRDLVQKYPPGTQSGEAFHIEKPGDWPQYAGMQTPGGEYYVGLDIESALHPQTLLCYAMNDKPLEPEHGAPLRLAIPVEYGVKNIKRIGTITFQNTRPADYWAEQGYDWYAGH